VYEFARLNITYTVLSKRRLLKLVKQVSPALTQVQRQLYERLSQHAPIVP
jgi:hypothetical protein